MKKQIIYVLIAICFGLTGCAKKPKTPADIYKGQSAKQIFDAAEKDLAKNHYEEAIKRFEALDTLYPFSDYQQQAQLDSIYAYFKNMEYASAAAQAVRYIHLYPRSEHVDYAYYMRGMANFEQDRGVLQRYVETDLSKRDLSTAKQAFADFAELIRRYPHSQYAPDARNRMIYLRNLLAAKEFNIAKFYYRRGSYVASANRANGVITHYQGAPEVIGSLDIMIKSYRKLGLTKLADETLEVLAYNYPESEAYKRIVEQDERDAEPKKTRS